MSYQIPRLLAAGAVIVASATAATPAHAATITATYRPVTGFGTQIGSANIGDTVAINNATAAPLQVVTSWGRTATVPAFGGVSFRMELADSGVVVAFSLEPSQAGAQPLFAVS